MSPPTDHHLQPYLEDPSLSAELRALLAAWAVRDPGQASSDARTLWDFLERKRPLATLVLDDDQTPAPLREALRAWLDRAPDHAIRDAQLLTQILGPREHHHQSANLVAASGPAIN
ncbi:hypothetical protein [Caulobacter sp. 17J65-9]|uniref:hypothetical protein n=1 Tax=Caulobacter sp. 17J65-9 TaxID=2709382 RepID=UPI0013CC73EE|nr:hypothetical protein [Caulobacter sp. 17J65-9]NEX91187.1 hypothetical protein [Caulobacter sp. 17J65-9]